MAIKITRKIMLLIARIGEVTGYIFDGSHVSGIPHHINSYVRLGRKNGVSPDSPGSRSDTNAIDL